MIEGRGMGFLEVRVESHIANRKGQKSGIEITITIMIKIEKRGGFRRGILENGWR